MYILGRGGCSGWRARVEQQAGHPHITNAGQILEIRTKVASDYAWFPLHPPLRNVDPWLRQVDLDGFYYHFNNLRCKQAQNITDCSAAHVVV